MIKELEYVSNVSLRSKNRKIRLEHVYEMDNLKIADKKARKGKTKHLGVRVFDSDKNNLMLELQNQLKKETYHTSPGQEVEKLCPCGKVRKLFKLPYFPDHIENHALIQVIMPTLMKHYYYDSSASIEGKGIHFAAKRTGKWIDKHKKAGKIYYVKLDFIKFYHNINQEKCYNRLAKKFGNKGIRRLLKEIITACDTGLGIGLYPIQPIANFYTCDLCREVMAKYDVFLEIYCDDIVIMGLNKKEVWKAVNYVIEYARDVMEQPLHTNIGMQIIDKKNFLDFVGYRFYLGHRFLRKRMKIKFKKKMARIKNPLKRYRVATSYKGWLMHCNGFTLWKKVMGMKSFSELNVPNYEKTDKQGKRILPGTRVSMSSLRDRDLIFCDVEMDVKSNYDRPTAVVAVKTPPDANGKELSYKFMTSSPRILKILQYVVENEGFPFKGRLVNTNDSGYPSYDIKD